MGRMQFFNCDISYLYIFCLCLQNLADDGLESSDVLSKSISLAISSLGMLKSFNNPKKSKLKKTRGPAATVARNYWYCLPEGSTIPKLSQPLCPVLEAHKGAGYGKT